jgi:predicted ribosome quality control (RQC) complex YloA/Tae2 family protein
MAPVDLTEHVTPYRHFIVDMWDIYIGKNDKQNDELTVNFGRPSDIWIHVASHAGSHVIVRRENETAWPPKEILETAASLAAWFSKSRNASSVKVHVTEIRFVQKLKNAPPGEVHIRKFKTLKVKPVSPQILFPDKYDK